MPAGYPYVVGGEPRNRQFPAPRSAQRQWGAIHGRFRAGFDATAGPCGRSATCVIGTSSGAGRGREPSRSADLRLFSERQRMRSGPDSSPPAATSTTWSATGRRGVGGVAGEAGDQSPMVARCSATTRRRRSVSLLGLAVGSLGCPGSLLLGGAAAAPGLAAYLSAAVEAGRLSVFIGACGAGVAPAGTSGGGRLVRCTDVCRRGSGPALGRGRAGRLPDHGNVVKGGPGPGDAGAFRVPATPAGDLSEADGEAASAASSARPPRSARRRLDERMCPRCAPAGLSYRRRAGQAGGAGGVGL